MSSLLTRLAYLRMADYTPDLMAFTYDGEAPDRVQGTNASTIELLDGGTFANPRNTGNYRNLIVNVRSDRSRDEDGLPLADDADRRAWTIYERFNGLFHDLSNSWSSVYYSVKADGPTLVFMPDQDEAVLLTVAYEVALP